MLDTTFSINSDDMLPLKPISDQFKHENHAFPRPFLCCSIIMNLSKQYHIFISVARLNRKNNLAQVDINAYRL